MSAVEWLERHYDNWDAELADYEANPEEYDGPMGWFGDHRPERPYPASSAGGPVMVPAPQVFRRGLFQWERTLPPCTWTGECFFGAAHPGFVQSRPWTEKDEQTFLSSGFIRHDPLPPRGLNQLIENTEENT